MKERLTIFTPTYNRAYILPKLYESLKQQTSKDFVWLIVDDGSTDDTKKVVQEWFKEKDFKVQYVLKENGGKHTAIEESLKFCKTEYYVCVDSDDYLSSDAVQVIYSKFDAMKDEKCVGFVGRQAKIFGVGLKPSSNNWPGQETFLFFHELAKKFNYNLDTVLVFKTEIIKKFHFPIFEDERFVTESVFYNQFMFDYKMLAIPELIYVSEYLTDGYTNQGMKLFYKNPKGWLVFVGQELHLAKKKNFSLLKKIKLAGHYAAIKKAFKIDDCNFAFRPSFCFRMIGCVLRPFSKVKKNLRKEGFLA